MPRVGFEPTIPVLERAKTVHGLDRAATVIGQIYLLLYVVYEHCMKYSGHTQRFGNWIRTYRVEARNLCPC
jgi:hypothetical protein